MSLTAVRAATDVEPLHRCNTCGQDLPAARMVKDRKAPAGVSTRCLGCRRAAKRRVANPDGVAATNRVVDLAPDPEPAARLRAALERHRAAGRPLSSAWPAAMSESLRGLSAAEVVSWRRVFTATRGPWASSYARLGWSQGLALSVHDLEG